MSRPSNPTGIGTIPVNLQNPELMVLLQQLRAAVDQTENSPVVRRLLAAAQANVDSALKAAQAAGQDAAAALEDLSDISSDGVLHPTEKLRVVREYGQVYNRRAPLEAQATSYDITTEKTAYGNAITALTNYLTGLSPGWTDTSQSTAIDRTTWNAKWTAAYDTEIALLNKIAAVAGERATWATVTGSGKPADNATVGATAEEAANINIAVNPYANLLRNPTGEKGMSFWPGSSSNWTTAAATDGYQFRTVSSFTNATHVLASDLISVPSGTYTLSAELYTALSSGPLVMDIEWWSATAIVGNSSRITVAGATGWHRQSITAVAPAGATRAKVRAFTENSTGSVVAVRRIMFTRSSLAVPFVDTLGSERDLRNMAMLASAQAGLPTSSTYLTSTDAGSTATISVASHTIQFGAFSVSYNAGSITGLAFGTRYYVYCDDPDFSGGATTYYATTNFAVLAQGNGRRGVGTITSATDGGGATVPENPWCVVEGMWLTDKLRAEDAAVGDLVDCWDAGDETFIGSITNTCAADNVDCVLLTTSSGAQVACSEMTPLTDRDNVVRWAFAAQGSQVGVLHGDEKMVWETIVDVQPIGLQRVYKLGVGGISYAAGVDPQHRVITHNAQYKP